MKKENEVFQKCLETAVESHKGQLDKSGKPYILHPLSVASRLDDLELKCIGLLHDVLEDTPLTQDDLLKRGIPERVVRVVEILSKPKEQPYEEYLKEVCKDAKALTVKKADVADNTDPRRARGLNDHRRQKYAKAKAILDKA